MTGSSPSGFVVPEPAALSVSEVAGAVCSVCPACAAVAWDAHGAAKPRGTGTAGDGGSSSLRAGQRRAGGAGRALWLQGWAALQRSHTGFLIRAWGLLISLVRLASRPFTLHGQPSPAGSGIAGVSTAGERQSPGLAPCKVRDVGRAAVGVSFARVFICFFGSISLGLFHFKRKVFCCWFVCTDPLLPGALQSSRRTAGTRAHAPRPSARGGTGSALCPQQTPRLRPCRAPCGT